MVRNPGITLIELIVVIAVIGVLVTAFVTVINPLEQIQKGRDTQRKNDLAQIQRGLELYYQDHGNYPTNSPSYQIQDGVTEYPWGAAWTPYMRTLPGDPSSSQRHIYHSPNLQSYRLYTSLERGGRDQQACNPGGTDCSNVPGSNLCGSGAAKPCNYGVSSPNISP